jgi:hypothetical protein
MNEMQKLGKLMNENPAVDNASFYAVIRDEDTDLTITHLTTSPITNHVCKYFPDLKGR